MKLFKKGDLCYMYFDREPNKYYLAEFFDYMIQRFDHWKNFDCDVIVNGYAIPVRSWELLVIEGDIVKLIC